MTEPPVVSLTRRLAVAGAATAGTAAMASAAGSLGAAAYFARRILTPDRRRPDDVLILEVTDDTVVLAATPDTRSPGRYGVWLHGGDGNARLGEVLSVSGDGERVTRELLGVDSGALAPGPARWNTSFWGRPPEESLGLVTEHVAIEGELGPLPAWVVPAAAPSDRWAILVHGRGNRREEALRALTTVHDQGWTALVPSYRNDEGVVAGPDGRYNLGLSEWRDIESAARYAVAWGARELLLGGWSMGGAIVLQFLDRSELAPLVTGVVLDGPVIDWGDVLVHHAKLNRVPGPVLALSRAMMGKVWGTRLVGVHDPVDVALTDWVRRADELTHDLLLIHSAQDDFVPIGPSRALAEARPDLVTFEEWPDGGHCAEWNVDPQRWERVVGEFIAR